MKKKIRNQSSIEFINAFKLHGDVFYIIKKAKQNKNKKHSTKTK
jgi:hypothetical protein